MPLNVELIYLIIKNIIINFSFFFRKYIHINKILIFCDTTQKMTNLNYFDRKIKTFFRRFDFDQNNRIEEDDFTTWAKKLVTIG